MDSDYISKFVDRLRCWNCIVTPGLSDGEVTEIEARFGFRFPPDLKCFLQQILPISDGWVDWRNSTDTKIQERLNWPLDGLIFDIEHNAFWLDTWGKKPDVLADAVEIAGTEVAKAPTLIPIFSHRYMPDDPPLAGNPVFSVYQTDIIYYGYDLTSYFENEFAVETNGYHIRGYRPDISQKQPRPIRFWDEIINSWDQNSSVP